MSLFGKIFGKESSSVIPGQTVQLLNGYNAVFTPYSKSSYNNPDVRACIDTIARNAAKLNPKHVRNTKDSLQNVDKRIQRIISEKPNELMNAYDFYYKVISELYISNNAFIYILRDDNYDVLGLYPLTSGQYELYEYKEHFFLKISFSNGKKYFADLRDIIHLKRMFCENEIFGGDNAPIRDVLSIKNVIDQGVVNTIKTTQAIRGILKSTKALLNPKETKKMRDDFVKSFVDNYDGSGIGALDATTEFKDISLNPQCATDSQVKQYDDKILKYYGLNSKIIMSEYSENEWNAFYESVIEPLGIMMSLEFTNKIFTLGERDHGNKIVFESNRLAYASNTTKVNVARNMNNYMTINEIREMFNLPPVEDGDRILQDLNHIDSTVANEYQIGDENKDTQTNDKEV